MFCIKEWYLITQNTQPNVIGGFENEAFIDDRSDAFIEATYTDIGTTICLCNSDLSKKQKVRCIIQGNSADTRLKSMERIGLFPIGIVKAGMYIFYEDRYWLITGYPGTNGIYDKATLSLCQYKLRWQNDKGRIIERWIAASSASKYDTGLTSNQVITVSSNNYTILTPDDIECLGLDGKRVFIDKNTSAPTRVFEVTRSDEILYDYGETHGGILSFILSRSEYNPNTDNQELGVCDYIPLKEKHRIKPKPTLPLSIITGKRVLKCGYERKYTVEFKDYDGNILDWKNLDFRWDIRANFDVKYMVSDNTIVLSVDDEMLIGKSLVLKVIDSDNDVYSQITIDIEPGF